MNDSSSSEISAADQVKQFNKLVNQIRTDLLSRSASLPPELIQAVIQLSLNLDGVAKQVAHNDDELRNMRALADIGQVVNSTLELSEVLRIVMDTIVRLTGAERGFLMLRNERGELTTSIARNWEQESIDSSEFAISRTVINRVLSDGQAILTTNAQEDPRFGGQQSIIAYNLRSILCVPLKVKDAITGVIYADNRVRIGIFSEAERNLLINFANQAAVALENARLFNSVSRTLAEVTELKNFMDNVFSSIASGVITADITDQIMMCNRAAEVILGYAEKDLVGHSLDDIIPIIAPELPQHITEVRDGNKQIVGLEYNSIFPSRGEVTLNVNLSPLKDATSTTQGITIVFDDLTENRRLQAQRRLFERMVSPAVIDQLDPDKLQLGGKRTDITTLFADIRGFTSFSESYDPEQLVQVLNRYLAVAAEAVLSQQGTIDKFLGDAIMAWFNAPIPQPDHIMRAIRAAVGIRTAVNRLCNELPAEFQLSFGVGIHYGAAVLGLVGTENRLDYTAIGDSVNTAKRIQENSLPDQILISDEIYQQVIGKVEVRAVEPIHAKGKRLPVQVYEVIDIM